MVAVDEESDADTVSGEMAVPAFETCADGAVAVTVLLTWNATVW